MTLGKATPNETIVSRPDFCVLHAGGRSITIRDRLSSHSSMRLRHKTSHGSSPCPPHNRDNPLST